MGPNAEFRHCVLIGPRGSGRSHIVEALSSVLSSQGVFRLSPTDRDWATTLTEACRGPFVLIDDVDGYDDRFRKTLFKSAADHTLRLCATTRAFDGRLARLWESMLSAPGVVRLGALSERPEDIREFLRRWLAAQNFLQLADQALADAVELIVSLRLPRGFVDLLVLLKHLASQGYDFSQPLHAPSWVNAYQHVLVDSKPKARVILLEGETDVTYFRWVAELALGTADAELAIEACGSAGKVAERSVACRNEGRHSVALFDFDRLGRRHFEDLRSWGHACLTIPASFDPLQNRAPEHVLQVVEIEDLLPIQAIEGFCEELQRQLDVEISLPVLGLRRLIPRAEDKLELARWVVAKLGPADAEPLLKVYNDLRGKLSLSPLAFPASRSMYSAET